MHITAIAVDDNPTALEILQKYAIKIPSLTLIKRFTEPLEALDYLSQQSVDMVFVDVEMGELSGIEFVRIARGKQLPSLPKFVICSAHDRYAINGYDLNVTDYLHKPVTYERFLLTLEKVKNEINPTPLIPLPHTQPKQLFVRSNGKTIRVRHQDMLYVQSDGHFVRMHVKEREHPLLLSYKMSQLEEMLPNHSFVRTHKRYIVNVEHIAEIDTSSVSLDHVELVIPVGGTYRHRIHQLCNALSA